MPPGVGLGRAANLAVGAVLATLGMLTVLAVLGMLSMLAVLARPPEQTELAAAATPSACAQEFPYAVPRPATQP